MTHPSSKNAAWANSLFSTKLFHCHVCFCSALCLSSTVIFSICDSTKPNSVQVRQSTFKSQLRCVGYGEGVDMCRPLRKGLKTPFGSVFLGSQLGGFFPAMVYLRIWLSSGCSEKSKEKSYLFIDLYSKETVPCWLLVPKRT